MQIYKGFHKQSLEEFVSSLGIKSIDDAAFMKIVQIIETLIFNMLNNVLHVTNALQKKIIKKEHFEAVLAMMNDFVSSKQPQKRHKKQKVSSKEQTGGHMGYVLPSEYFGIDSERHFLDVSEHETSLFAEGLARAAHEIKMMGGGNVPPVFSETNVKAIFDEYRKKKSLEFKVSKSAYEVVVTSVFSNLNILLKAVKKDSKPSVLKLENINNTLSKHCKEFAHLAYVWKN